MKAKKFSSGTKIVLIAFAIFIDIVEIGLSLIGVGLIVEIISGIFQYGIVSLFFIMHGSLFFMRRKTIKKAPGIKNNSTGEYEVSPKQVVGFVLESIPVIGASPIFTYNVWSQINAVNKSAEVEEQQDVQNNNIIRFSKIQEIQQLEQQQLMQNQIAEENSNMIRFKNQNDINKAA